LNLNPKEGVGSLHILLDAIKWYAVLKAKILYSPTIKSLFANGQAAKCWSKPLVTSGLAMVMLSKQVANTPW